MVYETDDALDSDLRRYGCAFLSLAHYNPDFTDAQVNAIKADALAKGIIDLEDSVQEWQRLVDLFGFPLKFRAPPATGHFPPETKLDVVAYVIGEWYNVFVSHFVVMDINNNVIYDPIEGGSNTVKMGHLVSYRLFDAV